MLPTIGSMITAAISEPRFCSSSRTAAMSLNGNTIVVFAIASGTPPLSGSPKVASPLPALTSR
jgi:hypothetical protein